MKKALFTLLIICTSSLTSDLIPETSALEDVDGRDFSNRQTTPGTNTKISPSLTKVIDKMAGAAALRNGAEGLSAEDFSTPLVKVDGDGNVQVYVHMSESSGGNIGQLKGIGLMPEVINADLKIVHGWLPSGSVEKAAELGFVLRITPPSYGHTRVGSVTTEGD